MSITPMELGDTEHLAEVVRVIDEQLATALEHDRRQTRCMALLLCTVNQWAHEIENRNREPGEFHERPTVKPKGRKND